MSHALNSDVGRILLHPPSETMSENKVVIKSNLHFIELKLQNIDFLFSFLYGSYKSKWHTFILALVTFFFAGDWCEHDSLVSPQTRTTSKCLPT